MASRPGRASRRSRHDARRRLRLAVVLGAVLLVVLAALGGLGALGLLAGDGSTSTSPVGPGGPTPGPSATTSPGGRSPGSETDAPARRPGPPTRIGVYNGTGRSDRPDEITRDQLGTAAEITSTYLPTPDVRLDVPFEQARLRRGTALSISLSTRGTTMLSDLAGEDDKALSWLRTSLADAAAVADAAPRVPVYITLDPEYRAKVLRGLITGPDADPRTYGAALARLYREIDRLDRPNLIGTYWIVGYDYAFEAVPPTAWGRERPGVIAFDPYARQCGESLADITDGDLDWITSEPWYDGQPVALGEFGMVVACGDEAMATFYTDLRNQLARIELEHEVRFAFAVLFNRAKDNDHQIFGREDGQVFPRAARAFRASVRAAQPAVGEEQ